MKNNPEGKAFVSSPLNGSIAFFRYPDNLRAVFSLPLNASITPSSSPRQFSSRGPQY